MKLLTYTKQDTFVHHLSGVTKLFFFLLWCVVSGLTYDTRVLAVMIAVSMWVIWDSRAKWEQFAGIAKLMAFFMIINVVCIFFFSPYIGCEIYNSRTDLLHLFGNYTITAEQLFYSLNVMMKTARKLKMAEAHTMTYKSACQEGWAPEPTNDVQRTIWKQVHAVPDKPITIEFDPKKDK